MQMFKIKAIVTVLISCLFDSKIEDDTYNRFAWALKFNLILVRTSHKSIAIIKAIYYFLVSKFLLITSLLTNVFPCHISTNLRISQNVLNMLQVQRFLE